MTALLAMLVDPDPAAQLVAHDLCMERGWCAPSPTGHQADAAARRSMIYRLRSRSSTRSRMGRAVRMGLMEVYASEPRLGTYSYASGNRHGRPAQRSSW